MAHLYALFADEGLCDTETRRAFLDHRDAFSLPDDSFISMFRLCKEAVLEICDAVASDLEKGMCCFVKRVFDVVNGAFVKYELPASRVLSPSAAYSSTSRSLT